jgi:putative DNA primase/helicase
MTRASTPVAEETVREALSHISPDLPRDEWVRVAMAIRSEFGDGGYDLFEAWSRGGQKYDARAVRDTWRSVRADGGVRIGTLLHLAREHGWRPSEGPRPRPSAEELRRRAREAQERERRERAEREQAQRAAAAEAERIWATASETGESGYLARKRVRGHGVRYTPDGWLVVPMRDADGQLWGVQRIAPSPPAAGPEKIYLRGARKTGLLHLIGDPADAPVLLIAEGYATAASVHEATGRPVAVAFDAGNLLAVARALRKRYPRAVIVICADDDRETERRTGRNPGRERAQAAAAAVRGYVALPEPLPESTTDYNDLLVHSGRDAVRASIEAVIASAEQAECERRARDAAADDGDAREREQGARDTEGDGGALPDRYVLDDRGVWYVEHDPDGRARAPMWVCSRLDVSALTRDADGADWGYLLEFRDPGGAPKRWAMPARMLAGDGAEYRAVLLALGLRIASGPRARARLTEYIQSRAPSERVLCTERVGWHGRAYVLPHETLAEGGERIVYQSDGSAECTISARGTLAEWREHVARYCAANTRLVFALACAFAAPLLRPAGLDSGGFHFRGESSTGKTTALRLAASVYGGPRYMQRWRATDNALEVIAAAHCDLLLVLDELAQVEPRAAGECAYMLANETSKARSTRTGQARPRLTWRVLFLSAGETGLAQHMAEAGKRARAGHETRLVDLPADAGAGRGIFEEVHEHEHAAEFAQALARACAQYYGTAGVEYLRALVREADTLGERVRAEVERLARDWVSDHASGQVQRIGRRFALVAVAGELATRLGITGWAEGEATRAVRACYEAWLAARGGIGSAEDAAILAQVRQFVEAHGEGRFTDWARAERDDDHAPRTLMRAGFRRRVVDPAGEVVGIEYYVLPETFRGEVCAGYDPRTVLRVLRDRGYLTPDKGRPYDCRVRLPGLGLTRCYRISSAILDAADE